MQSSASETEELRILEESGCLTLEAMCFTAQLSAEQHAVVERHIRCCSLCAQQHMTLARVAERVRGARPQVLVPPATKVLARQAAQRVLALGQAPRGRLGSTLRIRAPAEGRKPVAWCGSRWFWIILLTGLATALLAIVLTVSWSGCQPTGERGGPPPAIRLAAQPRVTFSLGQRLSAATVQPHQRLAAGTPRGEVLVAELAAEGTARVRKMGGSTPLHDGAIAAVAFSAKGSELLSAGGHVAAAWSTASGALIRHIRGPQVLTAATLSPDGKVAFFGTEQGHVLRWAIARPAAEAVSGFSCMASRVYPSRLQLPPAQRCPYGTYLLSPEGISVCTYPVTQLVVRDGRLLRACREGTLGVLELQSRAMSFYTAGHLRVLEPVEPGLLLLGRDDGALRLYQHAQRTIVRNLLPEGTPDAAVSAGELIAVAQGRQLRLWHRDFAQAVGGPWPLDARALWLGFDRRAAELLVLRVDGELLVYAFSVAGPR